MTVEEMLDAIQCMYFRIEHVRSRIYVDLKWDDAEWHIRIPNLFIVEGARIINKTWTGTTLQESIQKAWDELVQADLQAGSCDDSPRFWHWNDDTKRFDKRRD